jgi:hypothetical protein
MENEEGSIRKKNSYNNINSQETKEGKIVSIVK